MRAVSQCGREEFPVYTENGLNLNLILNLTRMRLEEYGRDYLMDVENLYLGYVRNGILVTSLGLVLYYSAHDEFHRGCSAVLMAWGMWIQSVTALRARWRHDLRIAQKQRWRDGLMGCLTALCVATFLTVEAHRGTLMVLEKQNKTFE